MLAPGAEADNCVALFIVRICRGDDLADAMAVKCAADLKGRGLAGAVAHTATHVGVDRHVAVAD